MKRLLIAAACVALANSAPVIAQQPSGAIYRRQVDVVVALVQLRAGSEVSRASLLEECAKHVARYKLPKAVIFLDHIVRSPSGKADYRWAKAVATQPQGAALS